MKSSTTPIPSPLKWAKVLAIFQLIIAVLAISFFLWLFSTSSTSEFVLGMQEGVADELGQSVSYLSTAEGLGFLVGTFLFGLLAPIFILLGISRKSKGWTIAALVVYAALLINSLSPFVIAMFILILQKPSREYLQLSSKEA